MPRGITIANNHLPWLRAVYSHLQWIEFQGTQFSYQGSCYKVESAKSRNFNNAQSSCAKWAEKANLISILNRYLSPSHLHTTFQVHPDFLPVHRFQQAFILTQMQDMDGQFWIGFTNYGNSNRNWKWISGYTSKLIYTHWDEAFTGMTSLRLSPYLYISHSLFARYDSRLGD